MRKKILACLLVLALTAALCAPGLAMAGDTERNADILATLGLVKGDSTGYRTSSPATRAHAAVLLVRFAGKVKEAQAAKASASFRDLPAWAAAEIRYAAQQGWVQGVSADRFDPDRAVTANAWCTMLLRFAGYESGVDFAVSDAARFARNIGLVSADYTGIMTRGDVFNTMKDALTFPLPDGSGTLIGRLVEQGACSRAAANALGLLSPELTAREVSDRHMSAMVQLKVYTDEAALAEAEETGAPSGNASGFFVRKDGLLATSFHAIDGKAFARVTTLTGETYPVERVVYYDADIDVALLKVSQTSLSDKHISAFNTLEVVGTKEIRAGDVVYTLGNPLGLCLAVSSGRRR